MTLRTRENTEILKNKHWITLSGEVALEEHVDPSQDNLHSEDGTV
jgi:hypothetical protein